MKDPVCGMDVSPEDSAGEKQYRGETYFFCSEKCLKKFEEDPEAWLEGKKSRPAAEADQGIYTCPMHPEVEQEGPGDIHILR